MVPTNKPIRVFYNDLFDEFWATQHWKETFSPDGKTPIIVITGKKYNVTQDIARAMIRYEIEFVPGSEVDGE